MTGVTNAIARKGNKTNRPVLMYSNSNTAPRLRGIKQKNSYLSTSM